MFNSIQRNFNAFHFNVYGEMSIHDIQCGDVDDDLWPCMAFHHFPQLIRTYRLFRMLYPRWNVVYLQIDANFQPKLVLSQVNVNKRIE